MENQKNQRNKWSKRTDSPEGSKCLFGECQAHGRGSHNPAESTGSASPILRDPVEEWQHPGAGRAWDHGGMINGTGGAGESGLLAQGNQYPQPLVLVRLHCQAGAAGKRGWRGVSWGRLQVEGCAASPSPSRCPNPQLEPHTIPVPCAGSATTPWARFHSLPPSSSSS